MYVGERHLFLRFSGCNLNCQYCDTPHSRLIEQECKVEQNPGEGIFLNEKNPFEMGRLFEIIKLLNKNKRLHSAFALTGGEPLLQIDFLLAFLPELKKQEGCFVYLETNGTLPKHIGEVINFVDCVSMDIKLASATGQSSYFKEHHEFMEIISNSGTELFVKIAVDSSVTAKEVDAAVDLIVQVSAAIPLVIQPVDPHKIKAEQLLSFQAVAKRKLPKVKIIPQIHKILQAK